MATTSTISERIVLSVGTGKDPAELTVFSGFSGLTASAAEINVLTGVTAGTAAASKGVVLDANKGITGIRLTSAVPYLFKQGTPTAKTTSTTLTAAEMLTGILTGNQGAAGAAAYQFDTGTNIETALIALFPGLQNDDTFILNVINISTNAAEIITMTTNTNLTLVGDMTVAPLIAGDQSGGTFHVRRTAANTYTIYRVG